MARIGIGHAAYKATYTKINPKESITKTGEFFKKNYDLSEPLFKKDPEGRTLNNLWTGYGYGGKGRALASASLLGGGTIIATNPRNIQGDTSKMQSEELDVESLQSTRSDGVGYQATIGTGASNMLTTSGDLVFAMHKTRHSGQF